MNESMDVNTASTENTLEVESGRARISELEAQLKEKDNKYIYLYAEFENFKKRSIKEQTDLVKYGWEPVARELLQVLDNLTLALAHAPADTDEALMKGLNMVLHHFQSAIQKQGVQPIESLGKIFDPHFHEAIAQEPSNEPPGTILKEHMRGYTLHGRLLRPSRVVVSATQ